jgi:hypothetical protein
MALLGNMGHPPTGPDMQIPLSGLVFSTTTPLAANATIYANISGENWLDTTGYNSIVLNVYSDKIGSYTIEFSNDKSTMITSPVTVQYDEAFANILARQGALLPRGRYVRIRYTNGATSQTVFQFSIAFSVGLAQPSLESLKDGVADSRLAMVVKSVLQAKDSSTGLYDFIYRDGNAMLVKLVNPTAATDVSALSTAANQTNGAQRFQLVNGNNQTYGTQAAPFNVANATIGSTADAPAANGNTNQTEISLLKGLLNTLLAGLTTTGVKATAATNVSVAVSTTSATLLAANTARKGATIENIGSILVYITLGATATTTNKTVTLKQGAYYEVPYNYSGVISAIGAASTTVSVTELT